MGKPFGLGLGLGLGHDLAGLVDDRHSTGARVFDDRALDDIDMRRALVVTVPSDNAARGDIELAQAEQSPGQIRRFLTEIDGAAHPVYDTFASKATLSANRHLIDDVVVEVILMRLSCQSRLQCYRAAEKGPHRKLRQL